MCSWANWPSTPHGRYSVCCSLRTQRQLDAARSRAGRAVLRHRLSRSRLTLAFPSGGMSVCDARRVEEDPRAARRACLSQIVADLVNAQSDASYWAQ